ncbi:BnaA01g27930D [Brassica napus]|uniref:BnaA01g27930D protein n=1 Tax=Brassica napus TaxID=3708 RepID=A0A078ICB9_BRANA|nr:BnaA01g27930D [Brassica napus]
MANFGEGRRRGTGGMLPLLAISTVAEYYRLPWKPPVTAGLLAANTLVYLRPAFLDPLIPHISEVWFNPNLILKHKDLKRFFLSAFYHLNEPHLVYNMMSLLWKGIKLETSMGSTQFASMVVTLLGMSQGVTLLLAKSLHVLFDYRRAYYHEYSVGFSGVLFALKVVLNAQAEDYTSVYGVLVPTKYAAWAELVLVQMFVPRASFLGHLGGILAGILYMKMKRSYSGSDPVAMVVRGVARAVTWPLRFVSSMVGSRRRRITGRGRVGRGQNGIAGPGIWRCQSCTFDNSGWESVCEMCGSGRSRGNGWSVNQGHAHSSSSSSGLPLDELRRRRVERRHVQVLVKLGQADITEMVECREFMSVKERCNVILDLVFLFSSWPSLIPRLAMQWFRREGYCLDLLLWDEARSELKLLTTDIGRMAMSAAGVNDIAAWILLALAIALSGDDSSPLLWQSNLSLVIWLDAVPRRRACEGTLCLCHSNLGFSGEFCDGHYWDTRAVRGVSLSKTDVTTIRGAQSWGLLLLIIVLNIGKDQKVLNDQAFAILVLTALVTTFITTPLLMAIYKPARRGAPYKHRTIQRKDHDSELRILACFNSTRNIPTLINMIESSRGTGQRGRLCVYAMRLMELSEWSSAIAMVHKARLNDPRGNESLAYEERVVESRDDVNATLKAMSKCNLFIVGRNAAVASLVSSTDCPELGPVGEEDVDYEGSSRDISDSTV